MVFDCSFDLMKPEAGEQQYLQRTFPARCTPTSTPTSAPRACPVRTAKWCRRRKTPASGGRHPLPSREKFAMWLSSVGFANGMQAVVYDRNGANYCGRLWWMLKWMGHDAVAVLDGGLQAWQAAGGEVTRPRRARALPVQLRHRRTAASRSSPPHRGAPARPA
jgi:thiosulfate/3-mercaptopyruvate sulfurtransferase